MGSLCKQKDAKGQDDINESDIQLCYGMSKMTVFDECNVE
jgi:hypothetical protein